jgi:hypothetical protein
MATVNKGTTMKNGNGKANGNGADRSAGIKAEFEKFLAARDDNEAQRGNLQKELLFGIARLNPTGDALPADDAKAAVDAALAGFPAGSPAFTKAKSEVSRAVAALRAGPQKLAEAYDDAERLLEEMPKGYNTRRIVLAASIASQMADGKYDFEVYLKGKQEDFAKKTQ